MTVNSILKQLEAIASSDDFVSDAYELVETWATNGLGIECVEPVLRFMEKYPDVDYGMPGPLVHYVEAIPDKRYEELLVASIGRRPTMLTLWMLNRVINGTKDNEERNTYLQSLRQAALKPQLDQAIREEINHYLSLHDN